MAVSTLARPVGKYVQVAGEWVHAFALPALDGSETMTIQTDTFVGKYVKVGTEWVHAAALVDDTGTVIDQTTVAENVVNDALFASAMTAQTMSTAVSVPVFCAPFACRVIAANIVVWNNTTIATSDTAYWTVDLARNRANSHAIIATKTTKTTGGEALAQRTRWSFANLPFDATNALFAAGDSGEFIFTPTGTPATLAVPVCLTIQYERVFP